MTLQMRGLKALDTFKVLSLIGKLGVKELIEQMFDGSKTKKVEDLVEVRGQKLLTELFDVLVTKLPLVETELNTFLADLCATDLKTIQELPFLEYIALIKAFFAKPELKDFLAFLSSPTK